MPKGVYDHTNNRHTKGWKIKNTSKMKGHHPKSEFKNGFTPWNKGKALSKETREKISLKNKGRTAWNKGKKCIATSGVNNPSWKGGVSSKDRMERIKFRKQMQRQVFERDDYTCQLCGIRGVELQVDHIQSWAEYIELRFCIDNCRTLCARCHYKITFGKPMPPKIRAWGHNLLKEGSNYSRISN